MPYTNQLYGDNVFKAANEIEDAAKMQYGNYRGYSGSFRKFWRFITHLKPPQLQILIELQSNIDLTKVNLV